MKLAVNYSKAAARLLQSGAINVVLENIMWDPNPPWQIPAIALEAEVIREVVDESGCGFVLDLAHASISARYFGADEQDYISALPVNRLRELHVSGTRLEADGLCRDHHPMSDADWSLAEWAMDRIRGGGWPTPLIVTLEYGGIGPGYEARTDAIALAEQVPRLRDMSGLR